LGGIFLEIFFPRRETLSLPPGQGVRLAWATELIRLILNDGTSSGNLQVHGSILLLNGSCRQ
jgi:hypothetical protein